MDHVPALHGKVALVTGAGRGIGRAIALELGKQGAAVVLNYARSAEGASRAVDEILAAGGRAMTFQADVSGVDQIRDQPARTGNLRTVTTYRKNHV